MSRGEPLLLNNGRWRQK